MICIVTVVLVQLLDRAVLPVPSTPACVRAEFRGDRQSQTAEHLSHRAHQVLTAGMCVSYDAKQFMSGVCDLSSVSLTFQKIEEMKVQLIRFEEENTEPCRFDWSGGEGGKHKMGSNDIHDPMNCGGYADSISSGVRETTNNGDGTAVDASTENIVSKGLLNRTCEINREVDVALSTDNCDSGKVADIRIDLLI